MSYIKIQFGGQKTNGGYLTIDDVNHGSLKEGKRDAYINYYVW